MDWTSYLLPIFLGSLLCAPFWAAAFCFACPRFSILDGYAKPFLPPMSDLESVCGRETTSKSDTFYLCTRYAELAELVPQVDVSAFLFHFHGMELAWVILSFGARGISISRRISGELFPSFFLFIFGLFVFYGACYLFCRLFSNLSCFAPYSEAFFEKTASGIRLPYPDLIFSVSAAEFYDYLCAEVSVFRRLSGMRAKLIKRLDASKRFEALRRRRSRASFCRYHPCF